jgi:elongation factor 3
VQAIQRKSCLIADNMAKLVDDPVHAAPFLPSVMPLVKRVSEEVADPEIRNVAGKALKTLERIEKDAEEIGKVRTTSPEWVSQQLAAAGAKEIPPTVSKFIEVLAMNLIDSRSFQEEEWVGAVTVPYLKPSMTEAEAETVAKAFVNACRKEVRFHWLYSLTWGVHLKNFDRIPLQLKNFPRQDTNISFDVGV